MSILLDASIGESIIGIIFGLLGFVAVIFLLVYFKMFLSKIGNFRYVDRHWKTQIDPDSFDNVNEMIGDKVSSLATSIKRNYSKTISADENSNIIKPKIGLAGFYLGDSISKVIDELGDNYDLIEHGSYSIEYKYRIQGISFYVKYNDIKKHFFSIKIFHPCKAKTDKGITLQSKLSEVIKIYGNPEYTTTEFGDIWHARIKGIEFCFARETSLPKYPFNETAHLTSEILSISI